MPGIHTVRRFFTVRRRFQELKEDYLSLAVTVVDILAAAYLFGKESLSDRRIW